MANDLTIKSSTLKRFGMAVLALLVLGLVVFAVVELADELTEDDAPSRPVVSSIKKGQYQAVVLSNDRIYIGRLTETAGPFWTLKDAHFIRETPATKTQAARREAASITEELVKPEPDLQIARDDVILVENLAKDSPVAAAVDRIAGS